MADEPDLDVADLDPDPEPQVPDAEPAELAEPQEQLADAPEPVPDQPQEPRQPTRGENRFQVFRNENAQLRTELANTQRRLDEVIQRMGQPQVQRESPEQRAARFALMSPVEQMTENLRDSEQRQAFQHQQMQMQLLETADRTTFQANVARDSLYAHWAPKVEAKLAELRSQGKNIEREVLMDWMIGNAARLNRQSKQGQAQVAQAQQRVAAQRTRPGNAGSDTQPQRRGGQTLEQRLENVQI